jgi:hypothetical protein
MTNAANFFAAFEACLPAAYEVSCRIRTGSPTSFWLDSPRTVASRRSFGSPVPRRRGLGRQAATRRRHARVYVFARGCQPRNGESCSAVRYRRADAFRRRRHPDCHRYRPGDGQSRFLRDEGVLRARESGCRNRHASGLLQRDNLFDGRSEARRVGVADQCSGRNARWSGCLHVIDHRAGSDHCPRSPPPAPRLSAGKASPTNALHPPHLILALS